MATTTKNSKSGKQKTQPTQTEDFADLGVEVSYVAAVYDNVHDAKSAYKDLELLRLEGYLEIIDAAYVVKTSKNKVRVHDYNDWSLERNTMGWTVFSALFGVEAADEFQTDISFNDKDLRKLAESLPLGSSALVAVVADEYVDVVEVELKNSGSKKTQTGKIPKSKLKSRSTK